MSEQLQQMRTRRLYGHSIGAAVGKEHQNQWLAMDLKLEHFLLLNDDERVAHVDHSDDVMLLREPSAEECAKSIAPLYQQMDYFLWQAFREGYWELRRRDALDVLLLFDGWPVCEILVAHGIKKSGEARRVGDYDSALVWCEDSEAACRALSRRDKLESAALTGHASLIRGDIYLTAGDAERALTTYDEARDALEKLRDEDHVPVGFQIASALWNSAIALTELGRSAEARERTRRAREEAERTVDSDSRAQAVIDAARQMEL